MNATSKILPRGSTPSIAYQFDKIAIAEIALCYLTIQSSGQTIIERDITTAERKAKSLVWKLTQEETLRLPQNGTVQMQIRYKLSGGLVGHSTIAEVQSDNILKEGLI